MSDGEGWQFCVAEVYPWFDNDSRSKKRDWLQLVVLSVCNDHLVHSRLCKKCYKKLGFQKLLRDESQAVARPGGAKSTYKLT